MFNSDISSVKGVGSIRKEQLSRLGIATLGDMLYHFPRKFEDRTKQKNIVEIMDGETAFICVTPLNNMIETRFKNRFTVYRQTFGDDSGVIDAIWFNNPYIKNTFKKGKFYNLYGKVNAKYRKKEIETPVFESADTNNITGRIVPFYNLTSGLTQLTVLKIIRQCLNLIEGSIPESIPDDIRKTYSLAPIDFSMHNIHFPQNFENYEIARKRFVFEEFLLLTVGLRLMRSRRKKQTAINISSAFEDEYIACLPFTPTNAQKRVIKEINKDLAASVPMNRLVEGDVGSGKTAVAAFALFAAVKSGFQGVMMAPTEILATQHYESLKELFPTFSVVLLSGKLTAKEKRLTAETISDGTAQIIVGTHALIESPVEFNNLGVVITDEQHRFGVKQRGALEKKGQNPHTLVMSATPIPRTLSLILYGDLDLSILDELPPGRQKTDTFVIDYAKRDRAYGFVRKETQKGHQAYIVCPLIEENVDLELQSVLTLTKEISKKYFAGITVEYIHGKMKSADKDAVMERFRNGETKILVSTTVIEVGVNVLAATCMIIENAERYGLSQLHQLRGRIGRSTDKAYCILISDGGSEVSKKRLSIMAETTDGFKISEADLKLRGPGDFFGTRQHGLPELNIANIFEDMDVLKEAVNATNEILKDDESLSKTKNKQLHTRVSALFKKFSSNGTMN